MVIFTFIAGEKEIPAQALELRVRSCCPVRPREHGVEALNRLVQQQFRHEALRKAREAKPNARRTPKPIGTQKIIYGDKVINVRNMRRPRVYPEENALRYVANGEIGIVVGEFRGKSWKLKRGPRHLEVEFSTQGGHAYTFWSNELAKKLSRPLSSHMRLQFIKARAANLVPYSLLFLRGAKS